MGGQWEAVARRSLRELPPRCTRHRPPTLCTLVHTHTHTHVYIHTCRWNVCVCACIRVAVWSAGQSSSMTRATSMISTENFPPQKWQNSPLAPPAGDPGPERAIALINGLPMYIFRPRSIPPSRTLSQIYETESTDCTGKNIRDHRPVSAIFHD